MAIWIENFLTLFSTAIKLKCWQSQCLFGYLTEWWQKRHLPNFTLMCEHSSNKAQFWIFFNNPNPWKLKIKIKIKPNLEKYPILLFMIQTIQENKIPPILIESKKNVNSSIRWKMFGIYGFHAESTSKWTIIDRIPSASFKCVFKCHVRVVRSKHILGIHKFSLRLLGNRCLCTLVPDNDLSNWESFR